MVHSSLVEARFIKEARSSDGRQSYSIRFFDSKGTCQCVLILSNYMIITGI